MADSCEVSFGPTGDMADSVLSPLPFGMLSFDHVRNTEVTSFEYSDAWLRSGYDFFLDPNIFFFRGRQYPPSGRSLFGMFSDCCPDRWGRTLLQRKEARNAALEQRQPKTLQESDYLLSVNDRARMGALRFSYQGENTFLAEDRHGSIPPWASLRSLEHAARLLEDQNLSQEQLDEELALLVEPGSSLGGARPKASVEDAEGELWIAKFPSKNDSYDTGLAEYLVYKLAKDFGLTTSEVQTQAFSKHGHTFLAKRFDRRGSFRIHFSSAMNLLGRKDGDNATSGTSYLDIANLIREQGSQPKSDLEELFKRILFSIAVSNTDDHLRNHGFLLAESGWKLSPLFDVNPNPQGRELSLNISELDNSLSFELALSQSSYFGVSEKRAQSYVHEVSLLVAEWEKRAKKLGMSRASIELLQPAFEHATR